MPVRPSVTSYFRTPYIVNNSTISYDEVVGTCSFVIGDYECTRTNREQNKAVYTTAPVAGGWAGAVMRWAGAETTIGY